MKFLALYALLAAPLFAHADSVPHDLAKSADGKTVVCLTPSDLNRAGYRPLISTLTTQDNVIKFNVGVAHLLCKLGEKGVEWGVRYANDAIPGQTPGGEATEEFLAQQRFLMVDRSSLVIGSILAENVMMQVLDFAFPVSSSFSREDLNRLDRGETVTARWEFFLQGTHSIKTARETVNLGLFTGGSYNLTFSIKKSGSGLEIVGYQFR